MSKKCNGVKIFFKSLLFILIGVISLVIIINLFVPVYFFDEPKPFEGEYLLNPYRDMDSTQWKQCNFHAHTRQYGGITNGRVNTKQMLDSVYNRLGFDHIGISDYNKINDYESFRPGYIPGYEHGYGIFKIHQLCLGAEKVRLIDYPLFQTLSMKQHMINKLGKHCRFAIPAHPSFTKNGYKVEDMKYLSNYKIMEVLNGYRLSPRHWDMALSNGHLVYLIADDDSHDVTYINDVAYRFTMVNTAENEADQIIDALENGKTVGVDFPLNKKESLNDKVERLKRNLPYLTKAQLYGDTLVVSASKLITKATFIGENGKILSRQKNIRNASYVIQPEDPYVRTVLYFDDGTSLYLNPITRHENENITKQRLDHINYLWTTLLWIAYCVIIFLIIRMIVVVRRRRNKKKIK